MQLLCIRFIFGLISGKMLLSYFLHNKMQRLWQAYMTNLASYPGLPCLQFMIAFQRNQNWMLGLRPGNKTLYTYIEELPFHYPSLILRLVKFSIMCSSCLLMSHFVPWAFHWAKTQDTVCGKAVESSAYLDCWTTTANLLDWYKLYWPTFRELCDVVPSFLSWCRCNPLIGTELVKESLPSSDHVKYLTTNVT